MKINASSYLDCNPVISKCKHQDQRGASIFSTEMRFHEGQS